MIREGREGPVDCNYVRWLAAVCEQETAAMDAEFGDSGRLLGDPRCVVAIRGRDA